MKINLTQQTIEIKGKVTHFHDKHAFNTAMFWQKALNPKAFRANNVGYELHKQACKKFGYSVS